MTKSIACAVTAVTTVVAPTAAAKAPTAVPRATLPPANQCPGQLDAGAAPPAHVAALQCVLNRVRASRGLPGVRLSTTLSRSAQLRADAIVRCRQFSHTPCGQNFSAVFRRVGYLRRGVAIGETLAWTPRANASPRTIVVMWLGSPPHRRVLLAPHWRELGAVSLPVNDVLAPGATQLFVAQFGRRYR